MSKIVERYRNGEWVEVFQADEAITVDHPSRRYRIIACQPGDELPIDEARRLGLVDADGSPTTPESHLRPDKSTVREDVGPGAFLRHLGLIK
jgi:hypothetical protein